MITKDCSKSLCTWVPEVDHDLNANGLSGGDPRKHPRGVEEETEKGRQPETVNKQMTPWTSGAPDQLQNSREMITQQGGVWYSSFHSTQPLVGVLHSGTGGCLISTAFLTFPMHQPAHADGEKALRESFRCLHQSDALGWGWARLRGGDWPTVSVYNKGIDNSRSLRLFL